VTDDPRERVCLDLVAWDIFWRILERAPLMDPADVEPFQLAAARRALEIAAGRYN
jgi:hypothetical protein